MSFWTHFDIISKSSISDIVRFFSRNTNQISSLLSIIYFFIYKKEEPLDSSVYPDHVWPPWLKTPMLDSVSTFWIEFIRPESNRKTYLIKSENVNRKIGEKSNRTPAKPFISPFNPLLALRLCASLENLYEHYLFSRYPHTARYSARYVLLHICLFDKEEIPYFYGTTLPSSFTVPCPAPNLR